jgi:hypothetical protein
MRVGLDLLPEVAHVNVDRARVAELRGAPERLEQHPPAEDAARMRHQRAEKLELDVRELRPLPAHLDRPPRHVDEQPHSHDLLLGARSVAARRSSPPQERLHLRTELGDRERLGDVVVGAELEPEHLVELVVAGREHDDRHRTTRPQLPADLEPVKLREHDVQHDEVNLLLAETLERLLAVRRLNDRVAVPFERKRQDFPHRHLVVDEENRGGVDHRIRTPHQVCDGSCSYYSPP